MPGCLRGSVLKACHHLQNGCSLKGCTGLTWVSSRVSVSSCCRVYLYACICTKYMCVYIYIHIFSNRRSNSLTVALITSLWAWSYQGLTRSLHHAIPDVVRDLGHAGAVFFRKSVAFSYHMLHCQKACFIVTVVMHFVRCMHVYKYTHAYASIYIYTDIHARLYATWVCVSIYIHTTNIHIHVHVCLYLYVQILSIYICFYACV